MAILVLVDEGRIDLDRPVLGDLADRHGWSLADPRMRAITVRQLLAHTSGLAASLPSFFDSPMATPDQAVGQVLALPLVDEPGRSFTYANVNFVLLGRLLQDVTGLDFATASRRLVLDPLGLSSFATVGTADRPAGDAHHWTRAGRNYMELLAAAGAWIASASDVARLVASIESGGVLSPTTRAAMLDPSSTGPLEGGWTYGLGVRLFPDGSYGHSGTLESSRSMALHLPDGTTVAVLVNGEVPKVTDDLIATIDWAATTLGR